MLWLDDYERRARLLPGLLTLLPFVVVVIALGLRRTPLVSSLLSLLSVTGGPVVLANLVRLKGRALERELFANWNGPWTVSLLRLRDQPPSLQREHRRRQLELVTGLDLPSLEAERSDPEAADEAYEVAVSRLRELTRDKSRFYLVFVENRNYGFERNLLAVRPFGVLSCTAAALALGVAGALSALSIIDARGLDVGLGAVIVVAIMGFWIFMPSAQRVRQAGERYAERLLDAATVLVTR